MNSVLFTLIPIILFFILLPFLLIRFLLPRITGAAQNARLVKTGVKARGIITRLEQTGATVNDQPRCHIHIQVEPEQGPPFSGVATRVILLTEIPQFQPGKELTVRYDPADPSKLGIEALGYVSLSAEEAERQCMEAQALTERLNQPGSSIPSRAIVRAFNPTGVLVNGQNPMAVLDVTVLPEGSAPFDGRITGVFGEAGLHKYRAGREIHVRVDPLDNSKVTIDLQAMQAIT